MKCEILRREAGRVTKDMMQAARQIRKWWEGARLVAAWAKGHAGLVLAAMLCVLAAVSVAEHDARLKRTAELGVMRREVATEVSALRQQAEAAIQESRASERVIRDLETRRTSFEREASALRARLEFLREEDRLRVRPAITPGHYERAGSAPSRPGPEEFGIRDSGLGTRDSGLEAEAGNSKLETGGSPLVTGQRSVAAQWRPGVTADPESQIQDFSESGAGVINRQPSIDSRQLLHPNPESRIPNPELDNCREQVEVQGQLISNCEERAELNRAALEAAKRSARELGEALRAKDAMAARLEEQHRAELKGARGSRLRRFGRALQYVGAGVVIGVVLAQ